MDVDHSPTEESLSSFFTSQSVFLRRGMSPVVSRRCSTPTRGSGGSDGRGVSSVISSSVGTLPSLCSSLRATLAGAPLRSDSKS